MYLKWTVVFCITICCNRNTFCYIVQNYKYTKFPFIITAFCAWSKSSIFMSMYLMSMFKLWPDNHKYVVYDRHLSGHSCRFLRCYRILQSIKFVNGWVDLFAIFVIFQLKQVANKITNYWIPLGAYSLKKVRSPCLQLIETL